MIRVVSHALFAVALTVLTQIGGLAWLLALAFRRRVLAFFGLYLLLSLVALTIAPVFGRAALPCFGGDTLRMQSVLYCALNRHYVQPELRAVLQRFATDMEQTHPGTQTLVLDANFPFFDGFPLLPHLSHDDGRKVDLAFYYAKSGSYVRGATRSPIGYFAFEDGPSTCPAARLTLRWDLAWLQPLFPDLRPEPVRMRTALRLLVDEPRIDRVFIEPHLKMRFAEPSDKIRFQGCRAARHDDHIHIQTD